MNDRPSLADRVVMALAVIRQMDSDISTSDEHRHTVWKLKNAAEAALASACQMVGELNDVAWSVKQDAKKLTTDQQPTPQPSGDHCPARPKGHGFNDAGDCVDCGWPRDTFNPDAG